MLHCSHCKYTSMYICSPVNWNFTTITTICLYRKLPFMVEKKKMLWKDSTVETFDKHKHSYCHTMLCTPWLWQAAANHALDSQQAQLVTCHTLLATCLAFDKSFMPERFFFFNDDVWSQIPAPCMRKYHCHGSGFGACTMQYSQRRWQTTVRPPSPPSLTLLHSTSFCPLLWPVKLSSRLQHVTVCGIK